MEAKHTETPWKWECIKGKPPMLRLASDPGNEYIAEVAPGFQEKAKANLALIVLAVNAHAALVEACKAVLAWHENDSAPDDCWSQVRAALALAEKGE